MLTNTLRWIVAFAFFSGLSTSYAQVELSAQLQRSTYLLFERVDYYVTIHNNSDTDLRFENAPGHPWLSFIVTKPNGIPLPAEGQSDFPPLNLKMGETRTLRVNLTPLAAFRQTGDYRCQAILDVAGLGQIMSPTSSFNVANGKTVWSQPRPVEGSQRIYSLIRFSPQLDRTCLYLRVESPDENVVYANLALGNLVAYIDPDVFFDPAGNIHVLQPISMGTYLYSRANPSGKIEHQGVFRTFRDVPPRLAQLSDGNVIVRGGMPQDGGPIDRLSDTQLTASLKSSDSKSAISDPLPQDAIPGKQAAVKVKEDVTEPDNGPGSLAAHPLSHK